MVLSKKRVFAAFSMTSAVIVSFALLSKNISDIAIGSILQISIFSLFFYIICRSFMRFDYVFVFFLFFVHMPQYIVHGFSINIELIGWFDISKMAETSVIVDAGKVCLLTIQFTMLGIMTKRLFIKNEATIEKSFYFDDISMKHTKAIGIAMVILGIFPSVYLDFMRILFYFHGGYQATHSFPLARSGIVNYMAQLWKYGVMILIMVSSKNNKKSIGLLLISIPYIFVSMLSGNRIMAIMFLVTIVIVFHLSHRSLERINKKKQLLKVGVLISGVYLTLVFINLINANRSGESVSYSRLLLSPFSYAIKTLSITISTVVHSVRFFPEQKIIGNGLTYFTSWLTVLPNFGQFLEGFAKYNIFTLNIPEPFVANLGGSYIGEIFYNFRYVGIFVSLIFGVGISHFAIQTEKKIKEQNYMSALFYLTVIPFLLQWPRAYFVELVRPFVWTNAILIVCRFCWHLHQRGRKFAK